MKSMENPTLVKVATLAALLTFLNTQEVHAEKPSKPDLSFSNYGVLDATFASLPRTAVRAEHHAFTNPQFNENVTYSQSKDSFREKDTIYSAEVKYQDNQPYQYAFSKKFNGMEVKTIDGGMPTVIPDQMIQKYAGDTLATGEVLDKDSLLAMPAHMEMTKADGIPDVAIITFANGQRVFMKQVNGKWQAEGWDQVMKPETNPQHALTEPKLAEMGKGLLNTHQTIKLKFESRGAGKIAYVGPERASN